MMRGRRQRGGSSWTTIFILAAIAFLVSMWTVKSLVAREEPSDRSARPAATPKTPLSKAEREESEALVADLSSSDSKDQLLRWRLGAIDPRFGLSPADGRARVLAAVSLWEHAAGKKLFEEDDYYGFPVEWVFDERQTKLRHIKAARAKVADSEALLRTTKARVAELKVAYESRKAEFERRQSALQARIDTFNSRVAEWNARGGGEEADKTVLDQEQVDLQAEQAQMKELAAEANSSLAELNGAISAMNEQVSAHNSLVLSTNEESSLFFEQVGRCTRVGQKVIKVEIFAFSDGADLGRTLTHELGHALGLGHVKDSKAIMYPSSTAIAPKSLTLRKSDKAELARVLR